MKAIILAAGSNLRLREYMKDIPKCLLSIGSSTILERHIHLLMKGGLEKEDIFVVTGYMHEEIRIVYDNLILNRKYNETDNAYSLHLALNHLHQLRRFCPRDEILVLDGDLVYDEGFIGGVIRGKPENMLVTRKGTYSEGSKDEVVLVDKSGRVREMSTPSSENSKILTNASADGQFVYVGVLKMSNEAARKLNWMLGRKRYWTAWYTVPLSRLLDKLTFFNFSLPESSFCFDIDTREDYERVRNFMAERMNR